MPKSKKSASNQQPKTDQPTLTTKLTWLPQKTFELEFVIPWEKVEKTYQTVIQKMAPKISIKGFRPGKAPLSLVEEKIGKEKIYEEVIKQLLPETYEQAVQKHHLQPIIAPKIKIISLKEKENWVFQATACEKPEVKLGDFKQAVRGELAKTNIWTPGKGNPSKKEPLKQSYDQKIKIVTQTLLKTAQVDIPSLLIDEEVNQMLTRLLDQIQTLGMTINEYLQSKGITSEQLKQSYRQQVEDNLKLDFILQQIAQEQKITVAEEEIEKMIQASGDEKTKEKMNHPLQKAYLASLLVKKKVIDYLINL